MRTSTTALAIVVAASVTFAVSALPMRLAAAQAGSTRQPASGREAALAAPSSSGLILGQVVDAETGQPVSNVRVTVSVTPAVGPGGAAGAAARAAQAGARGAAAGARGSSTAQLLTGADGKFVVRDLPPSTVRLTANASGYVTGGPGQARPDGIASPVSVADGARIGDVRIRLWRFAAVSGTIVDEAGEPAVGATVRVFRRTFSDGRPRFTAAASVRTDDRGLFRAGSLPPGRYVVGLPQSLATVPTETVDNVLQGMLSGAGLSSLMDLAATAAPTAGLEGMRVGTVRVGATSVAPPAPSDTGSMAAYQTLFYPGATSIAAAGVITLESGEDRQGIDVQLRLVPTLAVAGTVIGPRGPVGGVPVRLVAVDTDGEEADSGTDVASGSSAADGSFLLLGVTPGRYVVKAEQRPRPGMPAQLASNPLIQMAFGALSGGAGGQNQSPQYAQAPLVVGSVNAGDVALRLQDGRALTGRIVFSGAAPVPTPEQLQQMAVTLFRSNRGAAVTTSRGTLSSDGTFSTAPYPPGRYVVTVLGTTDPWAVRSVMKDGRDLQRDPFDLNDTSISDVVVTFSDKWAQLSGSVRAAAGVAPAPARIFLFPADVEAWISRGMSARDVREAAVNGSTAAYTIGHIPAGDYLAIATDDAAAANEDPEFFTALARAAVRVSIADGEQKRLDLPIVKTAEQSR